MPQGSSTERRKGLLIFGGALLALGIILYIYLDQAQDFARTHPAQSSASTTDSLPYASGPERAALDATAAAYCAARSAPRCDSAEYRRSERTTHLGYDAWLATYFLHMGNDKTLAFTAWYRAGDGEMLGTMSVSPAP